MIVGHEPGLFQSALRFAVVSDLALVALLTNVMVVSIRFEVRGGFRRTLLDRKGYCPVFQSALRFAVVSDFLRLLRLMVLN